MAITFETGRAYGDDIHVRKRDGGPHELQIAGLVQIIEWLGGVAPVPIPGPDPVLAIDIDLDNDGVDDVRVTVDDIPHDDDE